MTSPQAGPQGDAVQRAIGEAVRARREAAGLSMRALAGHVGVSQPFLSQLERGSTAASISTLYRLAAALGVAPGDLLPVERQAEVVVVRDGEGVALAVSEQPTAAIGRMAVGPGGRMSLTEYRVQPDEQLDSWFQTDSDITLHVIEGELPILPNTMTCRVSSNSAQHVEGNNHVNSQGHRRRARRPRHRHCRIHRG